MIKKSRKSFEHTKLDKHLKMIKYLYFNEKLSYEKIGWRYGCSLHAIYRFFKKWKIKARSISEINFKNAKTITDDGYIIITPLKKDKKYIARKKNRMLEHRLIMSKHLKRKLKLNEYVHHINGIRNDNRIENLELWSSSQPKGQKVSDKIKWAKQILKEYKNYENKSN